MHLLIVSTKNHFIEMNIIYIHKNHNTSKQTYTNALNIPIIIFPNYNQRIAHFNNNNKILSLTHAIPKAAYPYLLVKDLLLLYIYNNMQYSGLAQSINL